MSIQRERYGRFGIASIENLVRPGFCAWGCLGETTGDCLMGETTEPVWFEYGSTRERAIAKLKDELDGVTLKRPEPKPGSLFTCKGRRYMVYGVATGQGTSRKGQVIVYADMETGCMGFRTRQDFDGRMEPIEAGV